jgi:hypothetical protein
VAALATSYKRCRRLKMRTANRTPVGCMRGLDFHEFAASFADGTIHGRQQ